MASERHPPKLSAQEAHLLCAAGLLSSAALNALVIETWKQLTIERVPKVKAAAKAYAKVKFKHHGKESEKAAIMGAESALSDAFNEFFASHLPDLEYHRWAYHLAAYYGSYGLYEQVLQDAFEGDVAGVIFGSKDEDESHANALGCMIGYVIEANNLGSFNPYFCDEWDMPLEELVSFIRDWRGKVETALQK